MSDSTNPETFPRGGRKQEARPTPELTTKTSREDVDSIPVSERSHFFVSKGDSNGSHA